MQQRLVPRHVVVAEITYDKENPHFDPEALSFFRPFASGFARFPDVPTMFRDDDTTPICRAGPKINPKLTHVWRFNEGWWAQPCLRPCETHRFSPSHVRAERRVDGTETQVARKAII
ncbi:MAG: hypothetical protein QOG58_1742 [Caballeronia sp.]|nr:hypothetical protein [Caballeronia sp.]